MNTHPEPQLGPNECSSRSWRTFRCSPDGRSIRFGVWEVVDTEQGTFGPSPRMLVVQWDKDGRPVLQGHSLEELCWLKDELGEVLDALVEAFDCPEHGIDEDGFCRLLERLGFEDEAPVQEPFARNSGDASTERTSTTQIRKTHKHNYL